MIGRLARGADMLAVAGMIVVWGIAASKSGPADSKNDQPVVWTWYCSRVADRCDGHVQNMHFAPPLERASAPYRERLTSPVIPATFAADIRGNSRWPARAQQISKQRYRRAIRPRSRRRSPR